MPITNRSTPIARPAPLARAAALSTALLLSSTQVLAQVRLPVLGDALSGTISTEQEYRFGREFLRSVRAQTPLFNDTLIAEYITSLTYKLASTSELTDKRLSFALIDSKELNAFAAPGGVVGVNAGLFLYAQNEGQFASVLAHELAHISQRHYARGIEEQRRNVLPNMAGLLASLVIMATVGGNAGQAALMTSQAMGIDNQLRFSRGNEQEADRVGIRNLYNAGFDPADMGGMFEQMLRMRTTTQRVPEFLSTHPLDESRVADARNRARTYPGVDHVQNSEFLLMRERVLIHYATNLDAEITSRQRRLPQLRGAEADAARYGIALAQLKTGQAIGAAETLDTLLAKEPARITYAMLAADIAVAAKNYPRAFQILQDHLRINPDNHPLTMAYATALTKAGEYDKAVTVLEKHAALYPDDMQLWYDLAEVQGLAGNIAKVHQARAEYFITIGDFAHAKEQINFALRQERDQIALARLRQRLDYIAGIEAEFYH
ncbi:MAG: M48 family metalloprotease [Pseudomonadales bacterium]|jgi:predicted Zn-dependent protease|nr:M48 family metalloprotease [Pseudomonadales bacterium]